MQSVKEKMVPPRRWEKERMAFIPTLRRPWCSASVWWWFWQLHTGDLQVLWTAEGHCAVQNAALFNYCERCWGETEAGMAMSFLNKTLVSVLRNLFCEPPLDTFIDSTLVGLARLCFGTCPLVLSLFHPSVTTAILWRSYESATSQQG